MTKRLLILVFTLLVAPNAYATQYYVSNAATNGFVVGNDANNGTSVSTPKLTIANAISTAVTGDSIQVNCGTYSLGASALAVNKNVLLDPLTPADGVNASCVVITSANATSSVDLTASNDANLLRFGAFEVRNTGGAGQVMRILSAAYDATVQMSGTWLPAGGTNRHIQDQWVRGTIQINNIQLDGNIGALAAFYSLVTPTSAKSVTIDGIRGTLTGTASNTSAVYFERPAANSVAYTATVRNANLNVTFPSSLGSSALGIGIRFNRIDNALAEHNTLVLTTLGLTGADALGIVASSTDATATANNAVFRYNIVTCNGPATRCITIGTDGVTAFNASNPQIYKNTVTNNYYDGTTTPHGISLGRVTGGLVQGNLVNGFAVGIISAINNGGVISGNVVKGSYYAPLFSKGSGATTAPQFTNNFVLMDDSLYGAHYSNGYGCIGVASQSGTNNTSTLFYNNICYVKNGTGWKYVVVDASQVATFDGSDYWSLVSLTNPWSYQGTTYSSIANWNAAGTVGTELNVDPLVNKLEMADYRLAANSPLRRAGVVGKACYDFRGRPCWATPDVGAYQSTSRDPAAKRTLAQ